MVNAKKGVGGPANLAVTCRALAGLGSTFWGDTLQLLEAKFLGTLLCVMGMWAEGRRAEGSAGAVLKRLSLTVSAKVISWLRRRPILVRVIGAALPSKNQAVLPSTQFLINLLKGLQELLQIK